MEVDGFLLKVCDGQVRMEMGVGAKKLTFLFSGQEAVFKAGEIALLLLEPRNGFVALSFQSVCGTSVSLDLSVENAGGIARAFRQFGEELAQKGAS